MIEKTALGKTDIQITLLGMGCVTFGREIDQDTSFVIMDHALEKGINFFDTAAAYGGGASEKVLGKWFTNRGTRDQIVLASKVNGVLSHEHVIASAEQSLKNLRTDRIDLFQVHHWDEETPLEETLGALSTLVEQGKVRAIGCSNWSAEQMREALVLSEKEGFARMESVQPPYNLVQREIESELLPLCCEEKIATICYSPLGAGFLTGKYRRGQDVPEGTRFDVIPGHQPIYFTDHGYAIVERMEKASEETGLSMVQLAMAWVLNQKNVTTVLIGARNTNQVDQAFDALEAELDSDLFTTFE